MLAATSRYQSAYSPGGIGRKPLEESYSRCAAYGGEVMQTAARASGGNNIPRLFRSRQSAHSRRCFPISQRSPGRVTGWSGACGMSSVMSEACSGSSGAASRTASSSLEKPARSRSKPSVWRSRTSSASSALSHPAFMAILLSAKIYARRWVSLRWSSTTTGTSTRPSFWAARRRPWPAMIPPLLSTRIGLTNPNSTILAAICATCSGECVRAFRAFGRRRSVGQCSMCRAIAGVMVVAVIVSSVLGERCASPRSYRNQRGRDGIHRGRG